MEPLIAADDSASDTDTERQVCSGVVTDLLQTCFNFPDSLETHASSESDSSPKSEKSPPLPMLPPCQVCGVKASGYHYGANTCEACKGFFRRSLTRKNGYKCIGGDRCDIGFGNRANCSQCRLRKCLSLGMCKEKIKTGRYTLTRKNRNIREVKKLESAEKILNLSSNVVWNNTPKEVEELIFNITDAHKANMPHGQDIAQKRAEKEKLFLEKRELQRAMFGNMKPLPKDEYMDIYHATGMDIDGRKEMVTHFVTCVEKTVRNFVAFAKALPGFKDLPLADQIVLIKSSRVDVWLIWHSPGFNLDTRLALMPFGEIVDLDFISAITDKQLFDIKLRIIKRIQSLKLTYEELVVLGCVCFMYTDRGDLLHPKAVEESQERLVEALFFLLQRSHPPAPHIILAKCLSILTEMRNMFDLQQLAEGRLRLDWSDKVRFPPLLYEILTPVAP